MIKRLVKWGIYFLGFGILILWLAWVGYVLTLAVGMNAG